MSNGNIKSFTSDIPEKKIRNQQPQRPGMIQADSFLHSIPFLQILPIKTREKVISQFHSVLLPFGSIIVEEHHETDTMYVIGSGRVCAQSYNRLGQEMTVSMLEPGNFFGESSLLTFQPRSGTFRTCDHVQAFTLDIGILKHLFVTHPQLENFFRRHAHQQEIHRFLRLETIFSHMPPFILSKLGTHLTPMLVRANQLVIKRGEEANAIYIVREGQFQMFREEDGWEVTKDISPGDVFGELAPCKNIRRTSNVRAVTDGSCLTLDLQSFFELQHQAPPFKWQIEMNMGCHRWTSHESSYQHFSVEPIRFNRGYSSEQVNAVLKIKTI